MAKLVELDNSRPMPISASEYISDVLFSCGKADFSDFLFVLPTRSSARLVRFLVSQNLGRRGLGALMGLKILTPQDFFGEISAGATVADSFQESAAWVGAISRLNDSGGLGAVFPNVRPTRSDYLNLARSFAAFRKDVLQSGRTFLDASKIFAGDIDGERWAEFAELEREYLANLRALGVAAREDCAFNAVLAEAWKSVYPKLKKVFLVGLAEIPDLFLRALKGMESSGAEVAALVFSDGDLSSLGLDSLFDEYGTPLKKWSEIPLPLEERQIFVVDTVDSQANLCAEAVGAYGAECPRIAGIACGEADSAPVLIDALKRIAIDAYSPEGRPFDSLCAGRFLRSLRDVERGGGMQEVLTLLKNPFALAKISKATGFDRDKIVAAADAFALKYFPGDLDGALSFGARAQDARAVFVALKELINPKGAKNAADRLKILAGEVFFGAEESLWESGKERDFVLEFLAGQVMEAGSGAAGGFDFAEILDTVLFNAKSARLAYEKGEGSVALVNWLEIFWSAQAHVFINDFNGGILPSKPLQSAYLPDSSRHKIGLRGADSRAARDAYMFYTLLCSRKKGGMVSCIVPRMRANGDAVAPSELLLRCEDSALAQRVRYLFSKPKSVGGGRLFNREGGLRLPFRPLPPRLSASALKAYLKSPLRFYLQYVLNMRPNEYGREELNALEAGTFMHEVWRRFALGESAHSPNPAEIEKSLLRCFEGCAERLYGGGISGALALQLEILKRALPRHAQIQADWRAKGWKIKRPPELPIESFSVRGVPFKMVLDRVDENENGDVCVIDYKTFNNIKTRRDASVPDAFHRESELDPVSGERVLKWADLQLPLYVEAYKREFKPAGSVSCAYFIMAKRSEDCGIYEWDIPPDVLADALACADEVVGDILARKFGGAASSQGGEFVPEPISRKIAPKPIPENQDAFAKYFSFADGKIEDFIEWERGDGR